MFLKKKFFSLFRFRTNDFFFTSVNQSVNQSVIHGHRRRKKTAAAGGMGGRVGRSEVFSNVGDGDNETRSDVKNEIKFDHYSNHSSSSEHHRHRRYHND